MLPPAPHVSWSDISHCCHSDVGGIRPQAWVRALSHVLVAFPRWGIANVISGDVRGRLHVWHALRTR